MTPDNPENRHLIWQEEGRRDIFKTRVFTVRESSARSPTGEPGTFTILDAPDWAIIIPVLEEAGERRFVMVRQWRHGSEALSLEFPGGVFESGEDPCEAAARELREETAYRAGRIRKLADMSPNPAIMANRVHFFLAEDLRHTGNQELDADEYVDVALVSPEEVLRNMGRPPYIHALMAAALALYLQAPH
ncbi:MAG: NUDIX hydrolase [Treponema sp.]|jgi:8-oxo-dGTP pyrophosphatase MutT (NUDIX family)|nr:NUDIX hydrolase [Treponema sp.]